LDFLECIFKFLDLFFIEEMLAAQANAADVRLRHPLSLKLGGQDLIILSLIGLQLIGSNAHPILQNLTLAILPPGVEIDLLINIVTGSLLGLVAKQRVPLSLKLHMLTLLVQSVQVYLVFFLLKSQIQIVRKLEHA
jgi:hypothetical protein